MGAITSLVGGFMGANAANSASSAITGQLQNAIAGQQGQYNTTSGNLNPYIQTGTANLPAYQAQPGNTATALSGAFNNAQSLSNPSTLSMQQLVNIPSYQFALGQGLQATQANAASRGLGISGAAEKGAANYATGLANSTYQNAFNQNQTGYLDASNQFSNQNTAQNTIFNQLGQTVGTGLNASNYLGNYGQQSQNSISNAYSGIGTAQANGILGANTALTSGFNGFANGLQSAILPNGLFGTQGLLPGGLQSLGGSSGAPAGWSSNNGNNATTYTGNPVGF